MSYIGTLDKCALQNNTSICPQGAYVAGIKYFYGAYGSLSRCAVGEARSRMDATFVTYFVLTLWVRLAKMLFMNGENVGKS